MTKCDGFVAYRKDQIIGLATYMIINNECEILSIDSLIEKIGIGTTPFQKIKDKAIEKDCGKIKLITTNDNLHAIEFYRKRGFTISNIFLNAMEEARKLKPEIPLIGENGIEIKDEIEFEANLK